MILLIVAVMLFEAHGNEKYCKKTELSLKALALLPDHLATGFDPTRGQQVPNFGKRMVTSSALSNALGASFHDWSPYKMSF